MPKVPSHVALASVCSAQGSELHPSASPGQRRPLDHKAGKRENAGWGENIWLIFYLIASVSWGYWFEIFEAIMFWNLGDFGLILPLAIGLPNPYSGHGIAPGPS